MQLVESDLIMEALRVFFVLALPMVALVSLASTLVSALQGATAIPDPALGYAVRLLAAISVLYFFGPAAIHSLLALTEMVLK